jgi:murein DD-endopeptidase MepM/ murein hydrolase activator NlpD
MADRRDRSRKKPRKYNILLVPEGESGRSHSFLVTKTGVILSLAGALVVIIAVILVILVYTPVGAIITLPNPHLEERYVGELMAVQDRLNSMTQDVLFMREYNLQMRRALGEEVEPEDTTGTALLAQRQQVRREAAPRQPQREATEMHEVLHDPVMDYGIMGLSSGPAVFSASAGSSFRPTLPITLPADGYVTRRFDPGSGHIGIDIAGKINTPIASVAEGTVIFSGWTYHDGNMVIISHGGGYFSVYKHNQSNIVRQGAVVRRGEAIALLGNTGKQSYGPHLHFELWRDGIPLDPAYYMFDAHDTL